MIIYIKSSGTAIFREGDVLSFNVGRVDGDVSIGTVIKGYSWILILKTIEAVNDLQDKPEGLDVSVLPIGSVSGLPVAPHPYG